MSLLDEFEAGVFNLHHHKETKYDTMSDFGSTHLAILQSLSQVASSHSTNGGHMDAVQEFVRARGSFRRSEIMCHQELQASADFKLLAKEIRHIRQAQQQNTKPSTGVSLMDFTSGIAPSNEAPVLAPETLASRVAAFAARREKAHLENQIKLYNDLLSVLQKVADRNTLCRADVLPGSGRVIAPVSDSNISAVLEGHLLARLTECLNSSLRSYAAIDSSIAAVASPSNWTKLKRKRGQA